METKNRKHGETRLIENILAPLTAEEWTERLKRSPWSLLMKKKTGESGTFEKTTEKLKRKKRPTL